MYRWCVATLILFLTQANAQYTQSIELDPGWNAIYLEVVPENNDLESVFAGIPILSVWRFLDPDGVTGAPSNPSDGLAEIAGWKSYFPQGNAAARLNNLFTVRSDNAYLVHLEGDAAIVLTVTGRPIMQPRRWSPDAFTLTGFGVDPIGPPTFETYFAASTAHSGQPIYTLGSDGVWRLVEGFEPMKSGEAYWVYSRGSTQFMGPLEVRLDPGFRDLDFAKTLPAAGMTIINRSTSPQEVRLRRSAGGLSIPLLYEDTSDPQAPFAPWVELDANFPLLLSANGSSRLNIAPRRSDLQFNRAEQALELTNLDGARVLVFAAADTRTFEPGLPLGTLGTVGTDGTGAAINTGTAPSSRAGLWVGTASINEVNQAQTVEGDVVLMKLEPTAQEFPLRILVHIDAQDRFTLVSQVVQLFEEGTSQLVTVNNSDPPRTEQGVCTPGRSVLITRDELFSNYSGLVLRGDDFVGNRLSTIAYDFGEEEVMGELQKTYSQAMVLDSINNRYQTHIGLKADSASNPFFHRFHPDSDNRDDAFYESYGEEPIEVPQIDRVLALYLCDGPGVFLNDDPWIPADDPTCDLQTDPGAGTTLLAGKFEDVVGGLHKNAVRARGDLRLRRLTTDANLDPDPIPPSPDPANPTAGGSCTCDSAGVCP